MASKQAPKEEVCIGVPKSTVQCPPCWTMDVTKYTLPRKGRTKPTSTWALEVVSVWCKTSRSVSKVQNKIRKMEGGLVTKRPVARCGGDERKLSHCNTH